LESGSGREKVDQVSIPPEEPMPRRPRDPGVPQNPVQYFGKELRAYREATGLSRSELAKKIGYTPQWIGQIEAGDGSPSEELAQDCDTFFRTNGSFHRNWEWIQEVSQLDLLPPGFPEYLRLEGDAVSIHKFEAMQVSGLFQTSEYAYAQLIREHSHEKVKELVATRMRRQQLLEGEDAVHVVVVYDEYALRRPVGNAVIMQGQVQHLLDMMSRVNVTLQIVPRSQGAYAGDMGSFTILGLADGSNVAYEEGHVGGQLFRNCGIVRAFGVRFDLIRGVALSADASLRLLNEILESYERAGSDERPVADK